MHRIIARDILSPNVTRLVVEAARIAEVRQAGPVRHRPTDRRRGADPADDRGRGPDGGHDQPGRPVGRQVHGRPLRPRGRRRDQGHRGPARAGDRADRIGPCGLCRRRRRHRGGASHRERPCGPRRHGHERHRRPGAGPGHLRGRAAALRRGRRLHRRRLVRAPRVRHRRARGPARRRPHRPRLRGRPGTHDARRRRADRAPRRPHHGLAQRDHGRRHGHVWRLPRERRWPVAVRVRGRTRVRRPPRRLRAPGRPPGHLSGERATRHGSTRLPGRPARVGRASRGRRHEGPTGPRPAPAHGHRAPRRAGATARGARPGLRRGEPRLHRAAGRRGGRALPPVQEPEVHRGLPGTGQHPPLHRPRGRRGHAWRCCLPSRRQRPALRHRARLPPGDPVRRQLPPGQERQAGGDRGPWSATWPTGRGRTPTSCPRAHARRPAGAWPWSARVRAV